MTHAQRNWETANVSLASTALVQGIDDEAVVLDARTERYFELNAVGAFVLQLIGEPHTGAEVAEAISGEFEVDVVTAASDLHDLFDALLERGLITVD